MEASDNFFQKEETRGEDAWTVLLERKKRTKRMLGPLFPKGRNERRECLDYPTKSIERDGGLRLRDFSKEAEASA